MKLSLFSLLLIATSGVTASHPGAPDAGVAPERAVGARATVGASTPVPRDEFDPLAQIERMKAFIRQDAAMSYAGQCLSISLPDSAFLPIEISGGGHRELAVFYAHAECLRMGASGFSGTGGTLIQFWAIAGEDAPPRLLLEHDMLGFTPANRALVTFQHGGYCGVSGAQGCRVTYRWADGRLETAEREPGDPDRPWRTTWTFDGMTDPATPPLQATGITGAALAEPADLQMERMRRAVRQDAQFNYGPECGPVSVPDDAFTQIEITGDGFPELAVDLSRIHCPALGMTRFAGTGGAVTQFWHMQRTYDGRTGPVRLLLEQPLRAYEAGAGRLVTIQHDAVCPADATTAFCRVTYSWDARARRLERVERRRTAELRP